MILYSKNWLLCNVFTSIFFLFFFHYFVFAVAIYNVSMRSERILEKKINNNGFFFSRISLKDCSRVRLKPKSAKHQYLKTSKQNSNCFHNNFQPFHRKSMQCISECRDGFVVHRHSLELSILNFTITVTYFRWSGRKNYSSSN